MPRRRFRFTAIVALVVAASAMAAAGDRDGLPSRLTDRDFWRLVSDLSEAGGTFRSDNLLSNESRLQFVIPQLASQVAPGGAYLGVGPEQNFTYIAALKPDVAFIVDIRRGNLQLHLMYKALFELSSDRVDFIARLFSRPRPAALPPGASVADIFDAFLMIESSQ